MQEKSETTPTLDDFFSMTGANMRELCKNFRPFGVDNPEDAMKIAKVEVECMLEEIAKWRKQ